MLRPKAIEKESLCKERSRKRDSPVPGLARCELAAKRAWYTFWGLFSDYGSGNGSGSSATRRDGTPAHIRPQAGSAWTQCVSSYRLNSQNLNGVLKIQVRPYACTAQLHSNCAQLNRWRLQTPSRCLSLSLQLSPYGRTQAGQLQLCKAEDGLTGIEVE